MGCNCGKNSQPTGFGTTKQDAQRKGGAAIQSQEKGKGRTASFALRASSGKTMTFGSDLERRAEQGRNGGTLL